MIPVSGTIKTKISFVRGYIVEYEEQRLPVANFSTDVTEGNVPLSVQFTDLSENAIEWNWNFGDGNTSTVQNPTHTYSMKQENILLP